MTFKDWRVKLYYHFIVFTAYCKHALMGSSALLRSGNKKLNLSTLVCAYRSWHLHRVNDRPFYCSTSSYQSHEWWSEMLWKTQAKHPFFRLSQRTKLPLAALGSSPNHGMDFNNQVVAKKIFFLIKTSPRLPHKHSCDKSANFKLIKKYCKISRFCLKGEKYAVFLK